MSIISARIFSWRFYAVGFTWMMTIRKYLVSRHLFLCQIPQHMIFHGSKAGLFQAVDHQTLPWSLGKCLSLCRRRLSAHNHHCSFLSSDSFETLKENKQVIWYITLQEGTTLSVGQPYCNAPWHLFKHNSGLERLVNG